MLKVFLSRALSPTTMGEEVVCGICGRGFVTGLVQAYRDTRTDSQHVCLDCARYLRSVNPAGFPDVEEKLREWTTPEFATDAEADEAFMRGL